MKLRTLYEAARKVGRELLIEIIAGKHGPLDDTTIARALEEHYALGIKPDWWKLEPFTTDAAWDNACAAITRNDPIRSVAFAINRFGHAIRKLSK